MPRKRMRMRRRLVVDWTNPVFLQIHVHELRAPEPLLKLKRHGAIEDGLAGGPIRSARRIEGRAAQAGYEDRVRVALVAKGHGPEHVVAVEDVHVLIDRKSTRLNS